MAVIKPFLAIRSSPLYADQLVFTKPQTETVSVDDVVEEIILPLKDLLETGARLRPETPEKQEQAFHDVCNTLQKLLNDDQLLHEDAPGIYVYEVVHPTYRQTGIWALTEL